LLSSPLLGFRSIKEITAPFTDIMPILNMGNAMPMVAIPST